MGYESHKGKIYRPEPLNRDEINKLINATSLSTRGIRMRALIAVMYGGGLRISEALALRVVDVDLDHCLIRVRNGKGGKYGTVGLDPRSCMLITEWITRRRSLGVGTQAPLFCTYKAGRQGHPLNPAHIRRDLAALGQKAEIDKRVHPHGLRHSLAFDLAQSGVPMHVIKAQLRHASLAYTDRYVSHLLPSDVVAVMQDRQW